MNESQAQADGDGSESFGGSAIGRAQNDQQEEGREYYLCNKARTQRVSPGRVHSISIGGKSGACVKTCLTPGNYIQNSRAGTPASQLSNNVRKKVRRAEAPPGKQTYGNCWIQVTSGNMSDGISHG